MPKRRKLNPSPSTEQRTLPKRSHACPLCSASIPTSELSAHYTQELTQFASQNNQQRGTKRPAAVIALSKIIDRPRQKQRSEVNSLISRVHANRQKRRQNERASEIQNDGGEGREGIEECPVCGVCLVGIESTINEHVASCLDIRLREEQSQNDQPGGEEWIVYGHERAVDMLEGGIHSLPNTAVNSERQGEEMDVFVDVEGDAEEVYGRTQYIEEDLRNPKRDGKVAGPFPPPRALQLGFLGSEAN